MYAIAHAQHTWEDHAFVTTPVAWAVGGEEQSQCTGSILIVDCKP